MRVAFIGAGNISNFHHAAIRHVAGVDLVGVYDLDGDRCAAQASRWGVRAYQDLDQLLSDGQVDGVYVLAPHAAHADLAIRAIEAEKHVFIEKPVATTQEDLARVSEAARSTDKVVMPGHNYAYMPEFRRISRLARSGELGTLRAAWVTYVIKHPPEVPAQYGGAFEDLMIHEAYLALAMLGSPARVWAGTAGAAPARTEDQAWMVWDYDRGATAHMFASFAVDDHGAEPWSFYVKLLGTEGSASLTWRSATINRPMNEFISFTVPAYTETFEHISAAFRDAAEKGTPLISTVDDAAECSRLIAAAYASIESGQRVTVDAKVPA